MKTSTAGRAAIIAREGRRLAAYRDSVGVLTIGVGHTGRMAPPKVTPGMHITEAQCDEFLAADLAPVEAVLNKAVDVPTTQNEFDAMASLGFNIGVGGLRRSSVIARLNVGDVAGAAQAFLAWSKPAVLVRRRQEEKAQFLRPDAPGTRDVVAQRAATLAAKAGATTTSVRTDAKLAAGGAVVAGGIAAAVPAAQHHHGVLWIAVIVFGLLALGAAVTAVRGGRKAATLIAGANRHAHAAKNLDAGTTSLVDALQP